VTVLDLNSKPEENKTSEKCWISFINDDGNIKNGYYKLNLIGVAHIEFETEENIIILPINRLIKLKIKKPDEVK
jgi:hypothetical protein